jgi:short-subunit dehydrogenase
MKLDLASGIVLYKVDITMSDNIKAVAEKIRNENGDPTILINNAGVGH